MAITSQGLPYRFCALLLTSFATVLVLVLRCWHWRLCALAFYFCVSDVIAGLVGTACTWVKVLKMRLLFPTEVQRHKFHFHINTSKIYAVKLNYKLWFTKWYSLGTRESSRCQLKHVTEETHNKKAWNLSHYFHVLLLLQWKSVTIHLKMEGKYG